MPILIICWHDAVGDFRHGQVRYHNHGSEETNGDGLTPHIAAVNYGGTADQKDTCCRLVALQVRHQTPGT